MGIPPSKVLSVNSSVHESKSLPSAIFLFTFTVKVRRTCLLSIRLPRLGLQNVQKLHLPEFPIFAFTHLRAGLALLKLFIWFFFSRFLLSKYLFLPLSSFSIAHNNAFVHKFYSENILGIRKYEEFDIFPNTFLFYARFYQ